MKLELIKDKTNPSPFNPGDIISAVHPVSSGRMVVLGESYTHVECVQLDGEARGGFYGILKEKDNLSVFEVVDANTSVYSGVRPG